MLQVVGSISMACLFPSSWWGILYFLRAFLQVVTGKKKLVHHTYSDWSDARTQFKKHVNAISGIHSESMKNYSSSFFNEMAGKVVLANVQVVQKSEQLRKTKEFNCESLIFLKLLDEWVLLWGVAEMIQKLDSRLPMLGLVILLNLETLQYAKAIKIWKII